MDEMQQGKCIAQQFIALSRTRVAHIHHLLIIDQGPDLRFKILLILHEPADDQFAPRLPGNFDCIQCSLFRMNSSKEKQVLEWLAQAPPYPAWTEWKKQLFPEGQESSL